MSFVPLSVESLVVRRNGSRERERVYGGRGVIGKKDRKKERNSSEGRLEVGVGWRVVIWWA